MKQRIITVILIVILALILFQCPQYLPILVLVVSAICMYEWCKITPLGIVESIAFSLATIFLAWITYSLGSVPMLSILWFLVTLHCLIGAYLVYRVEKWSCFKINRLYVGIIGILLIATFANSIMYTCYQGVINLAYIIILIVVSDSVACVFDRNFGKNKLAPRTNPKKTRGGLIAGIVSAALLWFTLRFLYVKFDVYYLAAWDSIAPFELLSISLLTLIVSVAGDLFFNIIKNQNGNKNINNALLRHYSLIDRLGTMIVGVPTFLLLQHVTLFYIH